MKTLTTNTLAIVSGGASKSSEITTALKGVTDALSSQKNNQSSSGFDSTTMLMLGLMMSKQNSGPTVVQAGSPAPVVQGGPIVNISTRVRRGW
jgi:hypothetical protein